MSQRCNLPMQFVPDCKPDRVDDETPVDNL